MDEVTVIFLENLLALPFQQTAVQRGSQRKRSGRRRRRLTVNVLLLRLVLQGLVGSVLLINITDIQRKTFSTAMCKTAYERKTGTFSFTVGFRCDRLAFGRRHRHFVFFSIFFFKLPNTRTTTSSLHWFLALMRRRKRKLLIYTNAGKRPVLYSFSPSVAYYVCCCPHQAHGCKFTCIWTGGGGSFIYFRYLAF